MQWRKSSYSDAEVNCVEVAWRKSSFSADTVNCVEVAPGDLAAGLRDSKNPEGGHLALTPMGFRSFLAFTASR
jgi:hypothetical protein